MQSVDKEVVKVLASGLISRKETAKALGKTSKTLCEWAAKGIGPTPKKVGGRVFYDWDDVLAFVANAPR